VDHKISCSQTTPGWYFVEGVSSKCYAIVYEEKDLMEINEGSDPSAGFRRIGCT
jgi:hypothetical protein